MPQFSIPDESRKALLDFARMAEERYESLIRELQNAKPAMSGSQFLAQVSETFQGHDAKTLRRIVRELIQIEETRAHFLCSSDELADVIEEEIGETETIGDEEKATLRRRVKTFLDSHSGPLALSCKTEGIVGDHDRVFYSARIMTDVRSVFNASANAVDATVIVHTLVIHFGQDGDHKDIYVAMDTRDLDKLQKAIDRARDKEKTLLSIIQKANIQYIS